ncbi:MAG: DUF1259 domain-containing protein [Deltaproteobacteria bacterium]|nr:DUF1259 domain-containing protein [Deltaproteobacteria bacterium]
MRIALGLLLLVAAPAAAFDTALLARLAGVAATPAAGGVLVFQQASPEVTVTAGGVRLPPALGLASRAALQPVGAQALLLGELTLTEPQVNAVMDVALASGLDVTGLAKRFAAAQPPVMAMHVAGFGDPETLALAVGKLFAALRARAPTAQRRPPAARENRLDGAAIGAALGREGVLADGVYTVEIGRGVTLREQVVGAGLGVRSRISFAGRDPQALLDGELAVRESELQQTLRALRGHGIAVTGIQSHLVGETPRLLFVRFSAVGSAVALARDLNAVLAAQDK